ncbi:MAG: ferritin-like domain-containing protein [Deltaproteobacteria bacterium]|nr:ferritin-like domain-containing protein [Nannocystaceae bacterium]
MGLTTSALVVACAPSRRHDPNDPNGGGIADDVEVRRTDLVEGAWEIEVVEKPSRSRRSRKHLPTCSGGDFCVTGPRQGAVGTAPAPFDTCAQTLPYPSAPPPEGQDPGEIYDNYDISFSADWTSYERNAEHADACCYSWFKRCSGGRPLRDADGGMIVAPLARIDAAPSGYDPRDPARARYWARAAQLEHASIASFAQFTLQLLALGAPADLVARSAAAALDEIEHARLAFELAADFGGEVVAPGPMPMPSAPLEVTPVAVMRATLRDGCIAETLATLQARRDLADARTDAERDALARIADDEERHAELAFASIAWLLETFGAPVRDALAVELDRVGAASTPRSDFATVVLPCLRALGSTPAVASA